MQLSDEDIRAELSEEEWKARKYHDGQVLAEALALARRTTKEQAHKILQQHKQLGEYPEVCAENDKLLRENRELREALKPFALAHRMVYPHEAICRDDFYNAWKILNKEN